MFGEYPTDMRKILGTNLLRFSSKEKKTLNKALEFIGITNTPVFMFRTACFRVAQMEAEFLGQKDPSEELRGKMTFLSVNHHPQGMEKIVIYVKERYNNMPMYITENGLRHI